MTRPVFGAGWICGCRFAAGALTTKTTGKLRVTNHCVELVILSTTINGEQQTLTLKLLQYR